MANIPEESELDLTVSIVNWNTRQDLLDCLSSFVPVEDRARDTGAAFQIDGYSCEVIVVDNHSDDFSVEAVRQSYPVVRILPQERNLGFGAGHNRAFEQSRGRFVFVLNPDSHLSSAAIVALIGCAEQHPESAIFGPRVLNPDGSVQHSARRFPTLAAGLYRHSVLGRLFPNNPAVRNYLQTDWDHRDSREVDWVSGCAMLIRRSALVQMGGFEEVYYMYVEDVDICWRARQAGWTVWFCAQAEVTHRKARASDLAPNRMIYHHHRSMYIFFRRHYWEGTGLLDRLIVPLGLGLRASYFIAKNKWHKWLRVRR